MNPEELTTEQKETWGRKIEGSRYIRDFCPLCKEPIRVLPQNILDNNFCSYCDGHPRTFKKRTNLDHLVDYNGELEQ